MPFDLSLVFGRNENLNCEKLGVTSVTSVTDQKNQKMKSVTSNHTKHVTSTVSGTYDCDGKNKQNQAVARDVTSVTDVTLQKTQNQFLNFDGEDWLCWFDERAAIYEYEDGNTRKEAEIKAFNDSIIKWQEVYPLDSLEQAVETLLTYGLHDCLYKDEYYRRISKSK